VIVNPIGFTALGLASPTPLSTRTKFPPNLLAIRFSPTGLAYAAIKVAAAGEDEASFRDHDKRSAGLAG
jgi:hypothetical protein